MLDKEIEVIRSNIDGRITKELMNQTNYDRHRRKKILQRNIQDAID